MENITELYNSILPDNLFIATGEIGTIYSTDVLSESELEEYNTIEHQRRKEEYLSSRGIIKELVDQLGFDSSKFEIQKDGFGKPFGIYSDTRYNVSLGHTGRKIICAFSSTIPLGVDIEPVDRKVDERLRKRILHPDEQGALKDEPNIRLWTLKEALVKLQGRGLRTNLNQIKLERVSNHEFSGIFNDEKTARICSFRHCEHWIAVAIYKN